MSESKLLVIGGGVRRSIGGTIAALAVPKVDKVFRPLPAELDIRSRGDIEKALWKYKPNMIVYSAGVNWLDWLPSIREDQLQEVFDVNVMGFIRLISIYRAMFPDRTGVRVVAIASDAATRPMRTSVAYCASKAALVMAAKTIARETSGLDWVVNTVSPGKVSGTPMTDYVDQRVPVVRGWTRAEADAYEAKSTPGQVADTVAVAEVVVNLLLSPPALNGADIVVNGAR